MTGVIECRAIRRGRGWVAHVPEHGVYGNGRTLKAVRESIRQGLALVGVTAEATVVAVSPELEKLRVAEDAQAEALREAVVALALRHAPLGDIAAATRVPRGRIKAILAEQRHESEHPYGPTTGVPSEE